MKPWAEQFYNSEAWRSCRDAFLQSKGYLCERCSTPHNPVAAKIAHHKKTKEALFVLSERLTRNEIIMKIPDQTSASIVAALNKLERRYGKRFSQIFKSITFDNGSEFADCAGIERSVYGKNRKRTKAYYCHPYSAYERGTNENINKMIRRFLPKGTDFRKVTAAYIRRVETWINNYPREILGFATASDLFAAHLAAA